MKPDEPPIISDTSSFIDEILLKTNLYTSWQNVCYTGWFVFIVYEIGIGCDYYVSKKPLCPHPDNFDNIYWYVHYFCLGGFLSILAILISKLIKSKVTDCTIPIVVATNIVTISSITHLLVMFANWGGVCIDILNVASSGAIWGEWLSGGSMLIYLIITVSNCNHLTRMDCLLIICMFFCILSAFLIIIPQPRGSAQFFLAVSCLFYLPLLILPFYEGAPSGIVDVNSSISITNMQHLNGTPIRKVLSTWMSIILPLYTVNYLMALWGAIDYATTIEIYSILSLVTKGILTTIITDIHLHLLENADQYVMKREDNARKEFIKYIFHEVRTPLNSITMGIDLLEMSTHLTDEDKDHLENMRTSLSFMTDTLNTVLSLQKMGEGKMKLEITSFDIKKLINNVLSIMKGTAQKKKITITLELVPFIPKYVYADMYKLEHVITNLLSNAIKFSAENSEINVVVSFHTIVNTPVQRILSINSLKPTNPISSSRHSKKTQKMNMCISVSDRGVGISEEHQKLLFRQFSQIRPGVLQEGQGSGLGLAFVHQIVTLQGGNIEVHSKEGQGTTFKITIPVYVSTNSVSDRSKGSPSPRPRPSGSPGCSRDQCNLPLSPKENSLRQMSSVSQRYMSQIHALVVDDSEVNRKMLIALLSKHGVACDQAEDGKMALEKIQENKDEFSVIFLDNLMPNMNGIEATRHIRNVGYKNIIAGITGNVMVDDIEEFVNSGADIVYGKPLKLKSLKLLISHITKNGIRTKPNMQLIEHEDELEWSFKSFTSVGKDENEGGGKGGKIINNASN
jgi:signal transduction histidine kinase/ActR/RegA family two-component response regulator